VFFAIIVMPRSRSKVDVVHDAFLDALVVAEGALWRSSVSTSVVLAVVHVGDDGDVAEIGSFQHCLSFFAAKSTKYSKKFLVKGMFVDRYGVTASWELYHAGGGEVNEIVEKTRFGTVTSRFLRCEMPRSVPTAAAYAAGALRCRSGYWSWVDDGVPRPPAEASRRPSAPVPEAPDGCACLGDGPEVPVGCHGVQRPPE